MKELSYVATQAGLTLDKGNDTQIHEAIGLIADTETIELTGGTTLLETSANDTYVYNIADFTGVGLTVANTADIRALHIQLIMTSTTDLSTSTVECDYAGISNQPIGFHSSAETGGDDVTSSVSFVAVVPINKGQTTFSITLSGGSSKTMKIIAATKRTFIT
jgi:hypothetical protein